VSQKKFHINLTSDSDQQRHPLCYWSCMSRGDLYIPLLPASSSGLHMSFHKDFISTHKVHISNNYTFNVWAKYEEPDVNELKSYFSRRAYNPEHGKDVLVFSLPENYEGCYQQQISKNIVNLDINMDRLFLKNFSLYQIPVEILSKYFQASPLRNHVIFDEPNNSVIFYDKLVGIPLEFSREYSILEKQIETMPLFNNLIQSMKEAIQQESELVKQEKIQNYSIFPKKLISNIPKLKIKKVF
jgi:hypothetical protein